ncbi:MAG: hypothetical protein PHD11_09130 [Bacteroidales bacterium]|nr:hypothetical protein [Bacteroidales bacterium]MDD4671190.1 hypothetical protein [Bacteroidales bacterium]
MKHTVSPDTEVTVVAHFESIDSSATIMFPIVSFEQHDYIRAVFTYFETPLSAGITLISHNKFEHRVLDKSPLVTCSDSITFRIVRSSKNKITVFVGDQSVTFTNSLFEETSSYEIYSSKNNKFITSTTVSFNGTPEKRLGMKGLLLLTATLLVYVFFFLFYISKRHKSRKNGELSGSSDIKTDIMKSGQTTPKSHIRLFGNFMVSDKSGTNITNKFSPLLQQILILLIVNNPKGGISATALTSLLWDNKESSSARNNRAVNIIKLKKLLDTVGDYSISRNGDFYTFTVRSITVDFYDYTAIISSGEFSATNIKALISILHNTPFLFHCDYISCSEIKKEIQDEAISFLEEFLLSFQIKDNPKLVIDACNSIFSLDSLNEIALTYICRANKEIGNYALAKQLFSNFAKEYSSLYREELHKQFSEIMME